LKVAATDPTAPQMKFRLRDVPCKGPDLFVSMTARAAPRKGYPQEMARLMWVGISSNQASRGTTRFMTWCNQKDFTSGFYFSGVHAKKIDLEFAIEGNAPLWICELTAHAHPDAMVREFEHGVVLAKPSPRRYVFELGKLFPGRKFRRIQGTANQDTAVNNGGLVSDKVVLGPKNALFLIRER
jgi:hypothetical protein